MAPTISKSYDQAGQQITRDDDKWGSSTLGTSTSITYGFRPLSQDLVVCFSQFEMTWGFLFPSKFDSLAW